MDRLHGLVLGLPVEDAELWNVGAQAQEAKELFEALQLHAVRRSAAQTEEDLALLAAASAAGRLSDKAQSLLREIEGEDPSQPLPPALRSQLGHFSQQLALEMEVSG